MLFLHLPHFLICQDIISSGFSFFIIIDLVRLNNLIVDPEKLFLGKITGNAKTVS